MHACKDEYPLVHGDTYDIRKNYPYESYHDYGENYSPTEHHAPNMQLVYCVQVQYDDPPPTISNEKDFAYVESNEFSMLVDHDKNALCDSYIVEFIHDTTENYYESGRYASI